MFIQNEKLKNELPEVSPQKIDAICDMLMAPDILLYWDKQSPDFQDKLKTLLQANEKTKNIFQELKNISDSKTRTNQSFAIQSNVSGVQELNSTIRYQQLVSESVQSLVNLIELKHTNGIEILGPINQADKSADIIIEAAANALNKNNFNHVMFALGAEKPRHWYWVTISKTVNQSNHYSVEVFDPYCGESEIIYQFLKPLLSTYGIIPIAETPFVNNGTVVPQNDGYSCGYYAAAYAHLKVQQLDNAAVCNQDMIDALKGHGNSYHNPYLRDMCLHAVNPSKCPNPKYSNQLGAHFWSNQELSSRVWNRRGVQRAIGLSLLVEAGLVGLSFIPTIKALLLSIPILSSVGIPPLFLIMLIAAVATIYVSNRNEPMVINDINTKFTSFAV